VKIRRSAAIAGLAGVAMAAGLTLVGAQSAFAATPPYEPDPQSFGTLAFFDASGNQITTGSINNAPMAAYVVGTKPGRTGDTTTLLNMAQPNPNQTTANWNVDNLTGSSAYPLPAAGNPANIVALSQNHPVSKGTSGDFTVANFIAEFPNDPAHDSNTSYQNLYQVRLITANGADQDPTYQVADILVNGTTWTQVFGATATTTALTSSANPTDTATAVNLTATVTPSTAAGTVQFMDGSTALGSPVAVSGGVAHLNSQTFATIGTHHLSAVFTPTDTVNNLGSTGTLDETVTAPAAATATSLTVTQDGFAGDDVKLVSNVTSGGSAVPAGSGAVAFFDNGSSTSLGSGTEGPAGTFTLDLPSGLNAGSHSIVAKFTGGATSGFASSQSSAQPFVLQAHQTGACAQTGSQCTDTQNIQVTVPVGTLVISTPYTSSNPLDLGTMALDPSGTFFTANAAFNGIVVTDTRSGVGGVNTYTVSALSSPLSDGASHPGSIINAENVGLTGVTGVGSNGFAGTPTYHANAAANPPVAPGDGGSLGLGGTTAHDVFDVTNSVGTFTAHGTLTINAPTSTEAGLFTGTITFTVG
jgi:hypothetical protein